MSEQDGPTNQLTREDYFNDLAKAVEAGDDSKVKALMTEPPVEPEPAPVPEPTEEGGLNEVAPAPDDTEENTATEAGVEPAPADPTSTETDDTPKTPTPEELLTAANDRIKAVEAELHKFKSDAGRVPGLQKRMAELEKRLSAKGGDSDPSSSKGVLTDEVKATLEQIRDSEPALADALEKTLEANARSLRQDLDGRQREADQEEYDRLAEERAHIEYQKVLAQVPQAPAVFQSPDWQNWKKQLKPSDRAYAESDSAEEVLTALGWFRNDLQRYYDANPHARPQSATPAPAPVVAAPSQPATPAPAAAPRPKTGLAARPKAEELSYEDQAAQIWDEIGKREGYTK